LTWLSPDPLPSLAVNVTPTGLALFQPLAFGAGESDAETLGAIVSMTIALLAVDG
jgi:hypothetical protein